jgi:hypothetical protein
MEQSLMEIRVHIREPRLLFDRTTTARALRSTIIKDLEFHSRGRVQSHDILYRLLSGKPLDFPPREQGEV